MKFKDRMDMSVCFWLRQATDSVYYSSIWVKMPRKNNALIDVLFSQSLCLKCALLCLPGSLELD